MPLPNTKLYTTEDIFALPEGERAELIDGVIYDMAPPKRIHQKLISELGYVLIKANFQIAAVKVLLILLLKLFLRPANVWITRLNFSNIVLPE